MKKRRHAFTLIETLVGFSLFAILIVALMVMLSMMTISKIELKKASQTLQIERRFIFHLQQALDCISQEKGSLKIDEKNKTTLHFNVNNYYDASPHFFGDLKGRIQLNNKQLTLILESTSDKKLKRQYLLKDDVSALKYWFIYPTEKEKKKLFVKLDHIKKEHLPTCICIEIGSGKHLSSFFFNIPPEKQTMNIEGVLL